MSTRHSGPTALERICVFAGSRDGGRPEYREAANALGRELADRGIGLVYGAAEIGLMGALADSVIDAGGEAIGVLPEALAESEGAHPRLTRLHLVESMHARKAMGVEMASAFIALPGGLGSHEELMEAASWFQLGVHSKPIGVLNVGGFFDPLIGLLDHAVRESFLDGSYRDFLLVEEAPGRLLDRLQAWRGSKPP